LPTIFPTTRRRKATVNSRNNLAHCFHCLKNLNNIDLLMSLGHDFKAAVAILAQWLERHESRLPTSNATPTAQ
jgi:hypothetical protein